ncbi:MAG TPA: ABC transporter substrate-binding protein [Stellaceae bacterium]|nr:ABC transporter substrate-binding protein [Stellaceae bacterium]
MKMKRRRFLAGLAAAAAAGLPLPALAQARSKVKIGYLHTLAVDGQIWLGEHMGTFRKEGLEVEWARFTTGLELFQAMIGGSIEMLSTGAVISNFPARGQGKVFLINDIEFATAQLWVHPDQGVASFADLKGKKISTTKGTTAHVFLDLALRAHGLRPDDVEIVNQRMSEAVTSFISGAVPAVALWVPFNIAVREKAPSAKMLADASAYYPKAAIVDGWAARNDVFAKRKELLGKVIRAWIPANDFLVTKPDEALPIIQSSYYKDVPLPELKEMYKAEKAFTAAQWRARYADGTVTRWLEQVTDFFVKTGGISSPVRAEQYFDPQLFLGIAKA